MDSKLANGGDCSISAKQILHQTMRKYLHLVLLFTGLYFENEHRPRWRKGRIFVAFFVFGITLYQTLWRWVHFISIGANNLITAYVLVWLSKAVLTQFLLIRWQINGNIRTIMDQITRVQLATTSPFRRNIFICLFFYALFTCASIISTLLKLTDALHIGKYIDKRIFMLYGTEYLIFICFIVWFFALFAIVAVIILLNVAASAVYADFKEFHAESKRLKREADLAETEEKKEECYGEMAKLCPVLIGLTQRMGHIDHIFNVYLFIMVASNVPTTILVIIRFIVTFKTTLPDKWVDIGFQLPDLMFCPFELIGLILLPAKLHEIVHFIPDTYSEDVPLNKESRLQRRVNRFVKFMCTQAGLGITLLEFCTISKSMILTIFSLVFSYLMIVLRVFNPTSISNDIDQQNAAKTTM